MTLRLLSGLLGRLSGVCPESKPTVGPISRRVVTSRALSHAVSASPLSSLASSLTYTKVNTGVAPQPLRGEDPSPA